MIMHFRPPPLVAALSALVLAFTSGCGGGGDAAPVTPPASNHPPVLTTLALNIIEDSAASTQLAATDPDNNAVTFALTINPQHGSATVSSAGALRYTPASNYSGADSLGITVSDSAGAQASGTIAVTITAIDDLPVLTTLQFSVNEDGTLSTQLSGTDVENDAFTYELAPGAAHGTATLAASGVLTYSPNADYAGADQVHVRLVEAASGTISDEQIVSIDVLPSNDAPVAHDDILRVAATPGQTVALPALTNDVDVDGDTLTPSVITQPRGGTVTVDPATHQLNFEPTNEYLGPIEFTYRVNDGTANSNAATVRAVIGDFQNLLFLSDYSKPGTTELHIFDGLEVRRVSDDLPQASNIISYSWSGDLTRVAYVVDGIDAMRVYVKPLDGSAAATLLYTSAPKSPPTNRTVFASLNANGSFMIVTDLWSGPAKQIYMVSVATGATTRIANAMPGIVDVIFAVFHPFEPNLVMVQGQTAGNVPRDTTAATTAFLGDAADMSTLTQIGRNYSSGQYGAGEGFYFGRNPRYVYYGEYLNHGSRTTTTLFSYDRTNHFEFPVGPFVLPQDRGMNGPAWPSPDESRMCYAQYEPSVTAYLGPSRYYVVDFANPTTANAVTPVLDGAWQCTFASDNHTMIYRTYTPGFLAQEAYAVDSSNPGTPRSLAPPAEVTSEQAMWMFAHDTMRGTIAFFDNDGVGGMQGQVGRVYAVSPDGSGAAFLFANDYVYPTVSSYFYDLDDRGSFLVYARPNGAISSLEIMSTHALNYSIPLSRNGETVGVRRATWLQRYP
jgi:VCBS repeat-containing protein